MTKLGMSGSMAGTILPMLYYRKNDPKDQLYEPDDSIFRTSETSRLKLPDEAAPVYEEVQPFNQVWLWALMGAELVIILIPLILLKMAMPSIFLAAISMLIPLIILGSLKLKTRIDHEGVHFQMTPFHWKERFIPWSDIDQIYVRKYSPLKEYGGWGVRRGWKGWAYNVRGNYGIQIVKKNGKQILLGTQQPEEVMQTLKAHPLLV